MAMNKRITICLYHLLAACYAANEVEQAFISFGLTPDVVPVAPTKLLSVRIRYVPIIVGKRNIPLIP